MKSFNRSFNRLIVAAALMLAFVSVPAFAGDHQNHGQTNAIYGNGALQASGWKASGSANSSSSTSGGSESSTGAWGNGYTSNETTNFGGGQATAGVSFTSKSVTTMTGNNSYSGGTSVSAGQGNYSGGTDGGTGTNVSSKASGSYHTAGFGGQFSGHLSTTTFGDGGNFGYGFGGQGS